MKSEMVLIMDVVVNFFDKFNPVTTFFLALFNLILVFIVFRFTQKTSQSKLSISPQTLNVLEEIQNGRTEIQEDWSFGVGFQFREEGFPLPDKFTNEETLLIKVKNRGDLPSTKIKIKLKLKVYKTKLKYDSSDTKINYFYGQRRKFHRTYKITINIPYMGADEERLFGIASLYGQIREGELILIGIRANGHNYFRESLFSKLFESTIIHHYIHPDLRSAWELEDAGASLYGHKKIWEEFKARKKKAFNVWVDLEGKKVVLESTEEKSEKHLTSNKNESD